MAMLLTSAARDDDMLRCYVTLLRYYYAIARKASVGYAIRDTR